MPKVEAGPDFRLTIDFSDWRVGVFWHRRRTLLYVNPLPFVRVRIGPFRRRLSIDDFAYVSGEEFDL